MADAIVSVVAERLTAIIQEQIRNEVNLVRGVEKEVLNLSYELKRIRNVLDDAERRGFKNKSVKDWLKRLEMCRVQSTSFIDLAAIHGRDGDRDILVSRLMSKGGGQEELGIHILSIVGVGGVGKTTLAQLVYNDSRIKECFELRIWICVSDPYDETGIVKGIVESVQGRKKILLVLDDVWTEDYTKWEPLKNSLKCGGAGSKVLVTTRNERIHHLGQLSDEDCWLLLLFGRNEEEFENLKDIGKNIANKCKGLPLAAKALGSLLRFKNTSEEWENVLESEIWQLEEAEVDLFPHLLLSYNELSPALKRCFSYCAIFPKDSEIGVENLIGNWMALGYLGSNGSACDMELRGREYLNNLAMRSLFQDLRKRDLDEQIQWCKMHDIVHDFAQFLRKNTSNGRVEAGMKKTTCQACNPVVISHVKEYHSMFCHKEPPPHNGDCLRSLRVLSLRPCSLQSIPQEIQNLVSGEDPKTIYMDEKEQYVRMDVIDALEPHPNLGCLKIWYYGGSKLLGWIASPLNQGILSSLDSITFPRCRLWENYHAWKRLRCNECLDCNFWKKLKFCDCPHWKEWEDITAEERNSAVVSLMPCLRELTIENCIGLTALPHRLLRKAAAASLEGSAWKSISCNPGLPLHF
ncbi:hypothetical protein Pfo_027829 [Paulownia fortunei]|nr:hypothetical protein Pfo_027829 [Paulownia fortunei]